MRNARAIEHAIEARARDLRVFCCARNDAAGELEHSRKIGAFELLQRSAACFVVRQSCEIIEAASSGLRLGESCIEQRSCVARAEERVTIDHVAQLADVTWP